jgi:HlyD family secretion protein
VLKRLDKDERLMKEVTSTLDRIRVKKLPKWVLGLLILGLIGTGGYVAYSQVTTAQQQERQRRVQTAIVERLTLPVTISTNGTVQPIRSVNVSPKTSGVLKQLLVNEGDRVQAGQILANMDDANLQGQLIQSKAQLTSAQANLDKLLAGNRPQDIAQAQAQLNSAQAELQQAEAIFKQNQQLMSEGAIAQREITTSQATYNSAKARVDQLRQALNLQQAGTRPEDIAQARAQVMNAEGALKTIQTQIDDTVIRAPFDGVVTRKFSDPGAFVTPTTSGSAVSSATSSSILSIASANEIAAKVSETNIPKIKVGQRATISADAFPNRSFQGKVTQVATQSTVDQNVTNFTVKLSINDPKNELQAGMNVNIKFDVGTLDNALVIPTVAIVRQEQGTGVFVARKGENGKPKFQSITTGASVMDKTVVMSGVEEGDKILISFPQGERPPSRTPSMFPGMGGGPPGGSGSGRRGGG